jgi:hypothetical protein
MKNEDLKEVNSLIQYIKGIEDFIKICNIKTEYIAIKCGVFRITIAEDQRHEIIKVLEKIKSNTIEQLKELGVEADC